MPNSQSLISTAQALETLLAQAVPLADIETVATLQANRRVLAEDLFSSINVPGADNSQMDGYAVAAVSVQPGVALPVSQRIAAGQTGTALAAGSAARIFTGASMPAGADAVLMQEQCEVLQQGEQIRTRHQPRAGEWVRRRGEDILQGSLVLADGTRLRAQECGLAASVGRAELKVRRRPRVAVFFTGDELVMPGQPLPEGAIYNSNRYLLRALLENCGCLVSDFGNVPDQLDATREALRAASRGHDLVLTSGGVSVGEEDHVKPAVRAEGRLDLWQIAIKPGKPLAFGAVGGAHFLGLPGNPVSGFVTFLMLVRPFLLRLQGAIDVQPRFCRVRADFDWSKPDRRNEFLRVRLNDAGGVDLHPNQGSAVLSAAAWADGLLDNPPGQVIQAGDLVRFIPFSELLA